jgi:hypothetical protein
MNGSQNLAGAKVNIVKSTATGTSLSTGTTKITGSTLSHRGTAKATWCGYLNANDIIQIYAWSSQADYLEDASLYMSRFA